ncbi:MAG TPA: FISUMP domain-containing protein [Flavobacteriales bacterium]|nr:FISUMP domain-containing protein [Flavobacteriales bacterium]
MKNLYTTFFLISFGIIASLSAQTFKYIHRHDKPVIKIPIDLIDKVETVDSNGTRSLVITPFLGENTQIPLSEIDSITHYLGSVNPLVLGQMRTTSVMGVVRNANNEPVNNAIVRSVFGGEETHSDINGVFFLNDIIVFDKLGFVTIEKAGFHHGSRTFLPLNNGINNISVQLVPLIQSGLIFSAATGGQITSGPLQLDFPPNAFVLDGQPYTGVVRVYAKTLDPTNSDMSLQMPGELIGGLNDSLKILRSFGMASVELKDINLNTLQLAPGIGATVTYTIPSSLQAGAPQTIDWWSFDDVLGYWKHEGVAQKQGNQYVGIATHFSWWNLDVPGTFNELHGTILNASSSPVPNAKVNLTSPTLGTISAFTNSQGEFSGRVPNNQVLTADVFLICPTTNQFAQVLNESINSGVDSITVSYSVSLTNLYTITGTVVNCQSQPISQGYVSLGSQVYLTNQGEFTVQTCSTGEFTLQGFDLTTPDTIKVSTPVAVQVGSSGANAGTIQACSQYASTVSDIDGNVYPTVLIGSQLWMAENLRTTRFENGTAIPNVTDGTTWTQNTTPEWCNYQNDPANDLIYGKLYNGWAVANSNNVCPTGWHAPSIIEWNTLIEYLGGSEVAGGKIKSVDGWVFPATGGTNSSGFNGLPGGIRNMSGTGIFEGLSDDAYWWSSSVQTGTNSALHVYIFGTQDSMNILYLTKRAGMSVRCVLD